MELEAGKQQTPRKYSLGNGPVFGALMFLAFLIVWEGIVRVLDIPTYLIPTPWAVAVEFWKFRGVLLLDTWVTGYEILLGFGFGALIGFALAIGVVMLPVVERIVLPPAILTQVIPKLAIAPLLVVWFGVGLAPKVVITALMGVFPVLINAVAGLKLVDRNWLQLMHSLSANKWTVFTKVRLPNAIPHLFVGLKVGITLSVVGAIVGEWMGSSAGLGHQILMANSQLNTPLMFAALFLLSLLGIGLFALFSLLEAWLLPRHRQMSAWDQNFT